MRELEFIESFISEQAPYASEKFASRGGLEVSHKRDANDMVTEVDLTIQRRAVERIHQFFPGDAILAEEGTFSTSPKDIPARCWVMDPIDGTNNFVRGLYPIYGISIAFAKDGMAEAAGVGLPGLNALFTAQRGQGAFRDGKPLQVSTLAEAANARLDVDFSTRVNRNAVLQRIGPMITSVGQVRCHGSAVASICMVAAGDAEGYIHLGLSPWDYAAAQLIAEEAGAIATRLDGAPLRIFDGGKGCLIATAALHAPLLQMIAPAS